MECFSVAGMSLRIFIIQAGTYNNNGQPIYSITSKRQLESLCTLGHEVRIGLVTNRSSISGIRENIKRLKKEIQEFNPDVVHSHYGAIVGYVALKSADDTPLVTSFCGDDLLGTPIKGISWRIREFITKKFSHYSAIQSQQLIVKSPNLLQQLSVKQKKKTTIIPNGINADFFKPDENRESFREKMGWDSKSFVVFFNSSSGTNKEVKTLISQKLVFHYYKKSYPMPFFIKLKIFPLKSLKINFWRQIVYLLPHCMKDLQML